MSNLPYPASPTTFPIPNPDENAPSNQHNYGPQIGFQVPPNPEHTQNISTSHPVESHQLDGNPPSSKWPPRPYRDHSRPTPIQASGQGLTAEEVTALVQVGSSIAVNGRYPTSCVCPHCHESIKTRVEETKNEEADQKANSIYVGIGAMLTLIMIIMFIIVAVKAGSAMWLLGVPVVVIPVLGIIGCAKLCNDATNMFADVTHYCPRCGMKLGVSSGKDELDRDGRRRRY